ncbi:hypothetical protein F0L17_14210 [Streptomyces sp. TRM43335]|uniref:Uncharacterized protein n=1 Tax=Streptomyces taklimakanensis TaxID=2569853 RepID=A0A6G2BD81_9ACTN|nr:hypothetical protein [Streptomyces taklimakanensis]MTE20241.1 hypothetical protein [Streptomyces taklimakanensis]
MTDRHGTRPCYLAGCRCPECSEANYRYMARLNLDHARGHKRRVPADTCRSHIRALLDAGWLQSQISAAAGVDHTQISHITTGEQPTVARTTEQRILAVPPGPPPRGRDVDATGTRRRIQALVAIGHPMAHIAREVGVGVDAIGRIARGAKTAVRATTADTVAVVYRRMSRRPGASKRARTIAARHGWHSPLAWDAATIDDPTATPEEEIQDPPDSGPADRAAEVAHLKSLGESDEEIARRLGMSVRRVRDTAAALRTTRLDPPRTPVNE